MAGATSSSLIWSPWQATLHHYNNRFHHVKGYPFPCHAFHPICNSFNFKRRFSSSIFKDDHVIMDSSSFSNKQGRLSMSGKNRLLPYPYSLKFLLLILRFIMVDYFTFFFFEFERVVGCGCSWIQDNSMVHASATKKCSALPTKTVDVSSVSDLFEFICSGPLVDKIGITPENVGQSIDKWLLYGSQLCRLFQLNELKLTIPQKARL